MQFREQAKKLQFIRSVYNPETKRCDQKMVGSVSRYITEFPENYQIEMLTDKEIKELSDYLDARKLKHDAVHQRYAISKADKSLSDIADALLSDNPITSDQAIKIWDSIAAIQKALKKAGHSKPAKTAAEDIKVNDAQLTLTLPGSLVSMTP